MDYKKIHDNIVERAKNRKLSGYKEKHHILPKCLGGTNSKDNLVELTAKEHFIIHKLLVRIHPNSHSLFYALWAMSSLLDNQFRKNKRYNIGSREYNSLKKELSIITKNRLKENNIWRGKKHKETSKIKMSNSAKIRNISKEMENKRREGISKSNRGKSKSKLHTENIKKAKLGSKNPMFGKTGSNHHNSKKVYQYNLDNNFIKEWSNAVEVSKILSINYDGIRNCCKGITKTSGGFKWKYKN